MTSQRYHWAIFSFALVSLANLAWYAAGRRPVTLAAYATSLRGRTAAQLHNARLAAAAVNGAVIAPHAEFSFVKTTGPWTADRGYRKAPVSYDGELVRSFGGGVCQTSSTLYCAALAAGLEIVERHPHRWPARYVPPGGDAAVAPKGVDLRLRNPFDAPVMIVLRTEGDKLVCRLVSRLRPVGRYAVMRETTHIVAPPRVTTPAPDLPQGSRQLVKRGRPGCHIRTTRVLMANGRLVRSEVISEDTYPPMSEVIRVGTGNRR